MDGVGRRAVGVTGWVWAALVVMVAGVILGSPSVALAESAPPPGTAAPAAPPGKVVAVTVPALDLFDEKGAKVGTVAKDKVPVPLAIEVEAPNKRLRVKLDGKSVWIERRFVRVEGGTPSKVPCDHAASTGSRTVTALSTRGLDPGCRP